jgi:hypothetical protein
MPSRSIATEFWDDTWVIDLEPMEKYLFLYLLSNTRTNMLGIYELPVKKMANETGLEKEQIESIMKGFERVGKAFHKDNYIILVNFHKHQSMNKNMKTSAMNAFSGLPESILKLFGNYEQIKDYQSLTKAFESLTKALGEENRIEGNIEVEENRIELNITSLTKDITSEPEETPEADSEIDIFFLKTYQKHCHGKGFQDVPSIKTEWKEPLYVLWVALGEDKSQIETLFQKASHSSFLKNGSPSGWKPTFEWFLSEKNAKKVLSGKYDDTGEDDVDKDARATCVRCWNTEHGNCGVYRYGQKNENCEKYCPGLKEVRKRQAAS